MTELTTTTSSKDVAKSFSQHFVTSFAEDMDVYDFLISSPGSDKLTENELWDLTIEVMSHLKSARVMLKWGR